MAGLIPSFASGSTLVIRVGDRQVAYATSLSFVDDVSHAPIGGIGSYSYDALEPTQYIARGSFTIQRYAGSAHGANSDLGTTQSNLAPNPARSAANGPNNPDGNSMLYGSQFNPTGLLLSKTFDINVYEKLTKDTLAPVALFTIRNCRMTGYSIGFTPGQTVSENISFTCILIEDNIVSRDTASTLSANQVQL